MSPAANVEENGEMRDRNLKQDHILYEDEGAKTIGDRDPRKTGIRAKPCKSVYSSRSDSSDQLRS